MLVESVMVGLCVGRKGVGIDANGLWLYHFGHGRRGEEDG